MMDYNAAQKLIAAAMREFPATFGLRSCDGTFRISRASSYVNDAGQVMLYTEIQKNGVWLSYCKGSVNELRNAIVVR